MTPRAVTSIQMQINICTLHLDEASIAKKELLLRTQGIFILRENDWLEYRIILKVLACGSKQDRGKGQNVVIRD